ncbi:MAG: NAD(P)H azoreductase [Betaproteobacteria bacterium ADurb.Bin341]|nr:MAG: NAD(P)H azoreductase [Betaproteobacteria bacterium ADurb.Bin341]
MTHNILITGATGTIGSEVVKALKARGLEFAAMSSRPDQMIDGKPAVFGNFARPETLRQAFRGIDTLFLLQPLAPEMAEFGINAVDAAKAAGVRHIVRSSGGGADPDSPFAIAKVHGQVDRYVQESGLGWTLLRPNAFMQNFLTYYLEQIRSGAYYKPNGDGATSLVDVRDIAECAAAVLADPAAHAGRIYTLTGGEALTNSAQMAAISAAIGKEVRYVDVPEAAAVEAMTGLGFPPKVIDWLMSLNAVIKAGYAAGLSNDVRQLTGHAPRRFTDFVRENAAAWR